MSLDVKSNSVTTKASIEQTFKLGNGTAKADGATKPTGASDTATKGGVADLQNDLAKLASDFKALADQLGKGAGTQTTGKGGDAAPAGQAAPTGKAGDAAGADKAGGDPAAQGGGDQKTGGGLKDLFGGLLKTLMPMIQQFLGPLLGGLGIPGL